MTPASHSRRASKAPQALYPMVHAPPVTKMTVGNESPLATHFGMYMSSRWRGCGSGSVRAAASVWVGALACKNNGSVWCQKLYAAQALRMMTAVGAGTAQLQRLVNASACHAKCVLPCHSPAVLPTTARTGCPGVTDAAAARCPTPILSTSISSSAPCVRKACSYVPGHC
jgi:hypothetical protein